MSSNNDDSTSCTASNRPPDGPAVGADGDRPDRSDHLGRRSFVKGLGASAVGAAGLTTGTDSADAFIVSGSTALAIGGLAASAAGGAGLAYLARDQIDDILGNNEDMSGYTGADALVSSIHENALNMKSTDERVMTSIENNLANSETVAFAKGKAAALEKMNAEAPESEAVTAMDNAVDGYYATIEKNIIAHFEAQTQQIGHHIEMVDAHENLQLPNILRYNWDASGGVNSYNVTAYTQSTQQYTLIDGSTVEVIYNSISGDFASGDSGTTKNLKIDVSQYPFMFVVRSYNSMSSVEYFDTARYANALASVSSRASTVKTKLEGFVSDLYTEYGAGDIPTEDIIDPVTAATQMGQNTGMAGQAAEAAMLGIPTSASFSLWLELQDADGNTTEVKAEMYTTASPTDGSGNETGWEVGTTYDPANFDPPIYIAYEYIDPESGEKSSDFIELDHPFTVIEATDAEGNEVTNVQNEKRITQTADVTKLEEELQQLRDEQQRLQKEAQSGGGFSLDSLSVFGLPGEAVALGGAAVVSFFALGD